MIRHIRHDSGADSREDGLRLLPWTNERGNPCYLNTGSEGGMVARIADDMEAVQLTMGVELLDYAAQFAADRTVTVEELRFLVSRMTEALRDVLRIAESRGGRISQCGPDGEEGDGPRLSAEVFR